MSRISVVIPCRDAETHLAEAVASARRQTRAPHEILVVDDASRDRSPQVARRMGARVLRLPSNVGPSAARNAGLEAAEGELVAWLDADDLWKDDHLETVAGLLDEHPEAVLAFSSVQLEGDRRMVWSVDAPALRPFDGFWLSFRNTVVPQMSAVTRRVHLLEEGGYDEDIRIAGDYELFLRLARRYPFVRTDRVTAVYRQHPGQISALRREDQHRTVYRTRARLLARVLEEGDRPLAREMSRRMVEYWEHELEEAWRWNDHRLGRLLVELGAQVPAPAARRAFWTARVRARDAMLRGWWAVRPLVRGRRG